MIQCHHTRFFIRTDNSNSIGSHFSKRVPLFQEGPTYSAESHFSKRVPLLSRRVPLLLWRVPLLSRWIPVFQGPTFMGPGTRDPIPLMHFALENKLLDCAAEKHRYLPPTPINELVSLISTPH